MKKIVCLIGVLALGGCVSVKPVLAPAETVNALQGQPLTVVTYTRPDFSAMTYGRAAIGGLIGAGVMISEGNAVVRDNAISDPALDLAPKLTALVADRLKSSGTKTIAGRPASQDDEASLSAAAGKAGVILDVETVNWSFIYYPLDWSHYRILYVARARLIDANTGKRIAQAPCQYMSDDKSPPTYDQMLADKAALLKTMFAAATNVCADKMASGLYAP